MLPQIRTYQPGSPIRRALGSEWARLFDDANSPDAWTVWAPAADLYETTEEFILEMGLPGFDPDDIDVTVEHGILGVTGQRTRNEGDEDRNYHVREHTYERFTRSFSIPASVSVSGVRADFDKGMLVVTLPKAAEAKPRKIEVSKR
jgi:HSP20 family protein